MLEQRRETSVIEDIWQRSLLDPWNDIESRPKKHLRQQMVRLGASLANVDRALCDSEIPILSSIAETLHLGSLVVDDIQDGSQVRRGGPCLHLKFGIPVALNLGNYLYFEAYHKVFELNLPAPQKMQILEQMTLTLREGHLGQALDISVRVDEATELQLPAIVERSLQYKSGALMRFALRLGAIAASDFNGWAKLDKFGVNFGVLLQKLDDIGDPKRGSLSEKQSEDLRLRRPTWIWSYTASHAPQRLPSLREAVRDWPSPTRLCEVLFGQKLLENAFEFTVAELRLLLAEFRRDFDLTPNCESFRLAQDLVEKLSHAYTTP